MQSDGPLLLALEVFDSREAEYEGGWLYDSVEMKKIHSLHRS